MEHKYMINEYKYENLYLPGHFPAESIDRIKGFTFDGDLLVASYPKTGTTWVQELCHLIFTGGDFNAALSTPVDDRVPYLEKCSPNQVKVIDKFAKNPSPRLAKTHLPGRFLDKQLKGGKLKVILVIRNPLDTLVSLYNFYKMCSTFGPFQGSWDDFFELVKAKHILYGDYFDWYRDWLSLIKLPNVFLVKYEDMKVNLRKVIDDVTRFVGQESSAGDDTCLITDDTKNKMVDHLSFEKMGANMMTNYKHSKIFDQNISPFIRSGIIGDWKNYYNEEQKAIIMSQYRETLVASGLELNFE